MIIARFPRGSSAGTIRERYPLHEKGCYRPTPPWSLKRCLGFYRESPGVSIKKTICSLSVVEIPIILLRVVLRLVFLDGNLLPHDVVQKSWHPTLGRPKMATKPDLNVVSLREHAPLIQIPRPRIWAQKSPVLLVGQNDTTRGLLQPPCRGILCNMEKW